MASSQFGYSASQASFLVPGWPRQEVRTQVVPMVLTLVVPVDCYVWDVEFVNNTGSTATIQLTDGNGVICFPPQELFNTNILTYERKRGKFMAAGIKWAASVDGVLGDIVYILP